MRSAKQWKVPKALIFSMPHSNIKILTLINKDRMKGAVYNPYMLTKPIPWSSKCPHCKKGQQKEMPLKIRRAIQILCSNEPDGPSSYKFTLPRNCQIWIHFTSRGWRTMVRKIGDKGSPCAVKLSGTEPMGFQESTPKSRSPILLRTLEMLFSAREADETEIQAILLPLKKQEYTSLPRSRRTDCQL
jgi:hypothetical protein